MGTSSSKFKKYLQHGDEYAAMQVYQNSSELRKNLHPNFGYGDHHQHNTPIHYASRHGMKHLIRAFLSDLGISLIIFLYHVPFSMITQVQNVAFLQPLIFGTKTICSRRIIYLTLYSNCFLDKIFSLFQYNIARFLHHILNDT